MKWNRGLALLAATIVAAAALGQVTSNLTGRLSMDGNPLPGVTVTISSPNLQGTRTSVTDINGNYNFSSIPPGPYALRFEMESMQPVSRSVQIGLGQTGRADWEMKLAELAEAITVTASAPAILETPEVQSHFDSQLVDDLPMQRNFIAQANLAPNVTTNTTVGSQLIISGAPAHENLYMINGAVINENLRGQVHGMFIEDAIQETTVLTGAISAEYGRFTGGVVNAITKSGGNEFSGSIRDSVSNPSWTAKSFEGQRFFTKTMNSIYEGTFGGRVILDRLWFFSAARFMKSTMDDYLYRASLPSVSNHEESRLEGKLTAQLAPKHSAVLSYLSVKNPQSNYCFARCYEPSNIDRHRETPSNFATAHYNGIFTNNFLGEANWSRKQFSFRGAGGDYTDQIRGTWGLDEPEGAFYGAPVFCGVCGPEERNNNYLALKTTYYLPSGGGGTHLISAGYQDWDEQRLANNYQSGSSFGIYTFSPQTPLGESNGVFRPNIVPGDWITYWPVMELSHGSNFRTQSLFLNDKWDLNSHWQFNIGARYDRNHGADASGVTRARDALLSPRLGVNYDVFGNGQLRVNASYSQYVAKIAEGVGGGASGAGNPAYIFYRYGGPAINGAATTDAFAQLFDWFNHACAGGDAARCGTQNTDLMFFAQFPGVNITIPDGLKSPSVKEGTIGAGTQMGRGFARIDLISRGWADFYSQRTTGQTVNDPFGRLSDLQEIYTSNEFERTYRAATFQASYPVRDRFQFGGNYTWSKTRGNVTAETRDNGPVTETRYQYPEFKNFAQNNPTGYLPSDQRHKVRGWVTWRLPTAIGNFTFSALERFDSGAAFSAIGAVDAGPYLAASVTSRYVNRPGNVTYYFGGAGSYRWDDANALDLSINYRLPVGGGELFIQPELINAWNGNAVNSGRVTVLTAQNDARLKPFNPFTETPVEGVHYSFKNLNSGQPVFGAARNDPSDYQLARTYRLSIGLRF